MSRKLLFVLLLATGVTLAGVALADDKPEPTSGGEEQAQKQEEAKPAPDSSTGKPEAGSTNDAEDKAQEQDGSSSASSDEKTGTGNATDTGEKAQEQKDSSPSSDASAEKPGAEDAGDAEEEAEVDKGPKEVSGMSILGNQEAPKSLVIVPWKSSEIGEALGISTMLDDSRRPIDKEVFIRELSYYLIRSEKTK